MACIVSYGCAHAPPSPSRVEGPRDLYVLAHEDDELVFMSPTWLDNVAAGHVIRTVYLTAGNAGLGPDYWREREVGVEQAYARAAGVEAVWRETQQTFAGQRVSVWQLRDAPVSLIFVRLADGLLDGEGVRANAFESLGKLYERRLPVLHALDGGASYTKEALAALLAAMLDDFFAAGAGTLHTLNCQPEHRATEHPDHRFAAMWALAAAQHRAAPQAVRLYVGSDLAREPANLSEARAARKWEAFVGYAAHDVELCHGPSLACLPTSMYGPMRWREHSVSADAQRIALGAESCSVDAALTPQLAPAPP